MFAFEIASGYIPLCNETSEEEGNVIGTSRIPYQQQTSAIEVIKASDVSYLLLKLL
jgi:hypothetical protein